jgi:hypothetical protein
MYHIHNNPVYWISQKTHVKPIHRLFAALAARAIFCSGGVANPSFGFAVFTI